jgi:hypothetical protein
MRATGFLVLGLAVEVTLLVWLTPAGLYTRVMSEIIWLGSILGTVGLGQTIIHQLTVKALSINHQNQAIKSIFPLKRKVRLHTNWINPLFGRWITPLVFVLLLVYGCFSLVNRSVFELSNGSGSFCEKSTETIKLGDKVQSHTVDGFRTNNMCWATGVHLKKHTAYRIIMRAPNNDWSDASIHTDPGGFSSTNALMLAATPLKRWWGENWFTPIARIDKRGGEEYALRPCIYWAPPQDQGDQALDSQEQGKNGKKNNKRLELVSEFTTEGDGELFLFVNDAVLGWPLPSSYFYKNNHGTASVTIERIRGDDQSPYHSYCPR